MCRFRQLVANSTYVFNFPLKGSIQLSGLSGLVACVLQLGAL